ncbi:MAG: tryptophan synthase subunit beta like protein [Burkholderiaceae bacterium]|nr:MAG: tryptophan synthase subunit beta like protein [Burkholderiaceae bacterium]
MPYIKRDLQGAIEAVSLMASSECREAIADDAPELLAFHSAALQTQNTFDTSDRNFIRVLEDLVDLLMERDVIRLTDFPVAAQQKLLQRRSLRHSLSQLNLLGDEEDSI